MPESAEVMVAARQLDEIAADRVVEHLAVTHARSTRAQPVEALGAFEGRRVSAVRHHGKWILVGFAGIDDRLGIHLRMSGQLLARLPGDEPDDRHVHARLRLGPRLGAGPVEVWFRDPRTFGELRILPDGAPVAPDLHDPCVTAESLVRDGAGRRIGVKAVLLDQVRTVSGIGSYLADEALHRAGISPLAPAAGLQAPAWDRILAAARAIACESAAAGGVTLPDEGWVDLRGRRGSYAAQLRVHGRSTCATCGTAIRTAIVGGRSARWCPRCQDARRRR